MSNYTFLTKEQYFKDGEMLEVIKKRGARAAITDFSILLGSAVSDYEHIRNNSSLDGRTGDYWMKSDNGLGDVSIILSNGDKMYSDADDCFVGARPVLPFSSISNIPTNGVSGQLKKDTDGVKYVYYGYYPQTAVSKSMQLELEQQFKNDKLKSTHNGYTTSSIRKKRYYGSENLKKDEEYEYNGRRYVRVEANYNFIRPKFTLSNGELYKDGDYVWIEVEPIKWLVSERDRLMLADKVVFAGVKFNHEIDYHTEDFEKTDIKKFIDDYWSKEIEQVRSKRKNYGNWY